VLLLPAAALAEQAGGGAEAQRLELLVRAGRAFQDRRYYEALGLYRRAWAIDPDDGQPLVMAGVAAFETRAAAPGGSGAHALGALARQDLERALQRRLSQDDRELARTYLALLAEDVALRSTEARSPPLDRVPATTDAAWAPSVTTSTGAGYDTNARQIPARGIDTGLLEPGTASRSLFAAAGIQLAMARPIGRSLDVELRYGIEQRVHADRTLAELDFLDQEAALELSGRLGRLVRLGLSLAGDLSFSGALTSLHPVQRSLRVDPQLTVGD
jgi:hypothetical protein